MEIPETYSKAASSEEEMDSWLEQDTSFQSETVGIDTSQNLPPAPKSLEESGLSSSYVSDLIIKHLYRFGVLSGLMIAEKIALPFPSIDAILNQLVFDQYAEKRGGKGLGNSTDQFALTERGRRYSRDILEQDTYTGPAPVTFDQYNQYVKYHNFTRIVITEKTLREAWRDFIIDDTLFSQIGPAIRSGKSCFVYGPPGTGKTTLAKKISEFLDVNGGHFAIPHAILVGGSVIRVYDPVHHERVKEAESPVSGLFKDSAGDRRWVLCRRPTVVVGGELELHMLDLRYNPATRFYEGPLQMKSNGGVLIIDDFGRQLVKPKDLLNRWIVPLEEKIDYLTLHTGKKFSIPFEQLVVFATNLDPTELVDEAFLRRIRYKVYLGELSLDVYKLIFRVECKKKKSGYRSRFCG